MITILENIEENIDWRVKWNLFELRWLRGFFVNAAFGNTKLSHPYAHPRMTVLFCVEMHYLNLSCTNKIIRNESSKRGKAERGNQRVKQ